MGHVESGPAACKLEPSGFMPLAAPLRLPGPDRQLSDEQKARYEASLDGVIAVGMRKPQSPAEEDEFCPQFLSGLTKLLTKENNWTFLQPLCIRWITASSASFATTHVRRIWPAEAGDIPAYVPAGVLRRIINKYLKEESGLLRKLTASDIELNFTLLARLEELAHRCTLCRRCAQVCPLGVDNALISREIRKLFSQEMGIAARELHEQGTVQQLKVGSSTGITPKALAQHHRLHGRRHRRKTGKRIKIPVDKEGADVLLVHNAGEFLPGRSTRRRLRSLRRDGHQTGRFPATCGLRRGQLRHMV